MLVRNLSLFFDCFVFMGFCRFSSFRITSGLYFVTRNADMVVDSVVDSVVNAVLDAVLDSVAGPVLEAGTTAGASPAGEELYPSGNLHSLIA
jgi:hypothetical protein